MSNVIEMTHPLIQHKITRLRDKNTGTAEFSSLVEEIAMLMGYEALKDLPLEEIEIETPIETCKSPVIAGKKLAIVPILRAGLGMVSGVQALVPTAKIGHIGLYRDEVTHIPHEYYCKLPNPISERLIGLKKLQAAHPDIQIYVGHIDRELNENAYICPGLGDAGDRIFGTK